MYHKKENCFVSVIDIDRSVVRTRLFDSDGVMIIGDDTGRTPVGWVSETDGGVLDGQIDRSYDGEMSFDDGAELHAHMVGSIYMHHGMPNWDQLEITRESEV